MDEIKENISLIPKEEIIKTPSIKETKERVKNQKYKTYSLKHNLMKYKYHEVMLNRFFWDYNEVLNYIIKDIWDIIEWKEWNIEKGDSLFYRYKQKRLYPHYRTDGLFKTDMRHYYLKNWKWNTTWINSAIETAFSIMDSWKKNYNKGRRKREYPVVKRRFVRVKQTLMKIEKVVDVKKDKNGKKIYVDRDRLRISIMPNKFIYIDLSKKYFKINGRIGEPILTPTHIHLPMVQTENKNDNKDKNGKEPVQKIGWDLNKFSMDGWSPETEWIVIDLKDLYTKHVTYDNKRRRIQKIASTKKVVGKRLKEKYSKREKNACSQIVHNKTNIAKKLGIKHGFEDINKYRMKKKGWRKWNRWINNINWQQITDQMDYKASIVIVDSYHTSKDCSRCGYTNKDLKGEKFECINKNCGLVINRHVNAGINVYLKMEGLSQDIQSRQKWFDENVLSRFTQTGVECTTAESILETDKIPLEGTARKEINELVRSLYDTMKPQSYVAGV